MAAPKAPEDQSLLPSPPCFQPTQLSQDKSRNHLSSLYAQFQHIVQDLLLICTGGTVLGAQSPVLLTDLDKPHSSELENRNDAQGRQQVVWGTQNLSKMDKLLFPP